MANKWIDMAKNTRRYIQRGAFVELLNSKDEERIKRETQEIALSKFAVAQCEKVGEDNQKDDPIAMRRRFVISDNSVDRDMDTVNPKGWNFDHWINSPVVLFAHDYYSLPVAQGVPDQDEKAAGSRKRGVWVESDKVYSVAGFPHKDIYPFGNTVGLMVSHGFIRTASVGFAPIEWKFVEGQPDRAYGIDYLKQSLLEWSIVPVPANPNALAQAKSAGIDIEPLHAWAEQVIDTFDKHAALGVSKEALERIWKESDPAQRTVTGGAKWKCKHGHLHESGRDVLACEEKAETEQPSALALVAFAGKDFEQHGDDLPVANKSAKWDVSETDGAENLTHVMLRHHDADTGAVNLSGCVTALAALAGHYGEIDGLTPELEKAVEQHLRKHLADDFDGVACGVEPRHIADKILLGYADVFQFDSKTLTIRAMTPQEKADQRVEHAAQQFLNALGKEAADMSLKSRHCEHVSEMVMLAQHITGARELDKKSANSDNPGVKSDPASTGPEPSETEITAEELKALTQEACAEALATHRGLVD